MLPRILNNDYFSSRNVGIKMFAEWFETNSKENTGVTLGQFFDLHFELQLGYYIEWLYSNGVYIYHDANAIYINFNYDSSSELTNYSRADMKRLTGTIVSNGDYLLAMESALWRYLEMLETPF